MLNLLVIVWIVVAGRVLGSSCPHHCQCFVEEDLRTANCSGSILVTPEQQPLQVDILNIRPHYRAFRTKLTSRGFKNFKTVKFLNLSNTSITVIPNDVFHGLNYIITIDLSYNKIKRLNGGVFKELTTLQTLLLRGNPLILTQNDFIISKSLRKLDMGKCGLNHLTTEMFAHTSSLNALFLDRNYLQNLADVRLPSGLWYLNLANNRIVNVPINTLRTMKSLIRIDLSGNPVKCTCHMLLLQDSFANEGRTFENGVTCANPVQFFGQKLSEINENDLCNLEFSKKQRIINSIKHFRDVRSYRKHNMIKSVSNDENFDIQGDQPHSDEFGSSLHTEVMFTNDNTRGMGTHMSNSYNHKVLDISDENNKLPVNDGNRLTTDASSKEIEEFNEEHKLQEHGDDNSDDNNSKTEEHLSDNDEERDSVEYNAGTTEKNFALTEHDAGLSNEEEIFTKSVEDSLTNTETTIIHDVEELTNDPAKNTTQETMSRLVEGDKDSKNTSTFDELFQPDEILTSTQSSVQHTDSWPTSKSDLTDYNYDVQHDYSSIEPHPAHNPVTDASDMTSGQLTTEQYNTEDKVSKSPTSVSSVELIEGSGDDSSNETRIDDHGTAKWFEEQENETSSNDYSVENVSEMFNVSSDLSAPLSHYTLENSTVSEHTESDNFTTELSDLTDSSQSEHEEGETDVTTETEETTTEEELSASVETSSVDTTVMNETSSERSSVSMINETEYSTPEEHTTYITVEETTTESFTTVEEYSTEIKELMSSSEPSSTVGDISSSNSPSVEITSEEISEHNVTSEESVTESVETSTDSSPTPMFVSGIKEDVIDDTVSSTSATSEQPVETSASSTVGEVDVGIPAVSSSTPVPEVEFVSKSIYPDDKENMILDPNNEEILASEERSTSSNITLITAIVILSLLVLIIIIISLAVICRRSKRPKNKIRLPVDTEANHGTEMQDMLLPKQPENGVKVIPKNYTNGTTAVNGSNKIDEKDDEEKKPVLSADPEPEQMQIELPVNNEPETNWEEKPEPIETVTARLTMLARPQTPVFIPKTLN